MSPPFLILCYLLLQINCRLSYAALNRVGQFILSDKCCEIQVLYLAAEPALDAIQVESLGLQDLA